MQRVKEIPNKARFNFAQIQAYKLLVEMGFSRFPVSPWDIINEYESIDCYSWSELRKETGDPDPCGLKECHKSAAVYRRGSDYLIVYDDVGISDRYGRAPSEARIRWTIMHEIGHIFLFHLHDFEEAILSNGRQGGLTNEQYGILEKEAHYFAAEMYIPTALFKYFDDATIDDLEVLCDISKDAARRRHRALYENNYHPNTIFDNAILRNFNDFVENGEYAEAQYSGIIKRWGKPNYKSLLKISRKCPKCHSFTVFPEARYCTHCGYDFEQYGMGMSFLERMKAQHDLAQSFSVFQRNLFTDDNGKLLVCPVCGNQDLSSNDKYCTICGQRMHNICFEEGKQLDPGLRHCPDCGSEATFDLPYASIEKRLVKLQQFVANHGDPDNLEYDHWQFMQGRIKSRHPKFASILFCTKAYLTDDDDLIVYTDDVHAVPYIERHSEVITKTIEDNECFKIKKVEVRLANVL